MNAKAIKAHRQSAGLSQGALAAQLGVTQGTVSHWERGRSVPRPPQLKALRELFNQTPQPTPPTPSDAFGEWLRTSREAAGWSRDALAARSGISSLQVRNIETGRTASPRETTRRALEEALQTETPPELVRAVEESAEIQGVGRLSDFDPHSEDDFPREPGVYVFYDVSDRPVYIGKSGNIRDRIRNHTDKFWYRSPIVETAAYVRVDDPLLRGQLEETLIKFLKSNAVINQQLVER